LTNVKCENTKMDKGAIGSRVDHHCLVPVDPVSGLALESIVSVVGQCRTMALESGPEVD